MPMFLFSCSETPPLTSTFNLFEPLIWAMPSSPFCTTPSSYSPLLVRSKGPSSPFWNFFLKAFSFCQPTLRPFFFPLSSPLRGPALLFAKALPYLGFSLLPVRGISTRNFIFLFPFFPRPGRPPFLKKSRSRCSLRHGP